MINVLDYFFYRVYSFYKKKKESIPVFISCVILSLAVSMPLVSIMLFTESASQNRIKISKLIALIFFVAFIVVFWYRYKNETTVSQIERKYSAENVAQKRTKGVFILLYIIIVISMPVLYGILKHNLHYI